MFFSQMCTVWNRRAGTFPDRRTRRRKTPQRRPLFLEPLEDRTLLTAWTALGPAPILNGEEAGASHSTPVSGRITGIAADPHNADIVYIAAASGGIWKTTNATAASPTWTPLIDDLTINNGSTPLPLFMGAIAETDDPNGNQIVYAGSGEANNSASYYGYGILVSKDGGNTWTLTNYNNGDSFKTRNTVAKIVIDPSDPSGGTAYAALDSNGINGGTDNNNTGIYKTTNFGQTWTNVTAAAPNNLSTTDTWSDVVIDPHTPSTLYAAEGSDNGSNSNGVYRSTDSGGHWSLLTNCPSGTQDGRIALALYDDGATNELFVSIVQPHAKDSELFEMLESTNPESTIPTFTALSNVPNYMGENGLGQGFYDTTLAVDPTNPNYLYAGGSDNDGAGSADAPGNIEGFYDGNTNSWNWQTITHDSNGNGPHSDDHAVAFDANGNLLDGNDGGIFRLNDPTSSSNYTWSDLNTNLQITQFYSIAVDPTVSNVVYGGNQDNGTVKYTGNLGWNKLVDGDGGITRLDPANHNIVYQERENLSLRVSTNGGTNFTDNLTGDASGTNPINGIKANTKDFYVPYALDASGNIYYGTDYLNFSSTQGGSWSQIGGQFVNGNAAVAIDAIAVNPVANSNVVYVSVGGDLFVTQNAQQFGNANWTQINLPVTLPHGFPLNQAHNNIAIDPSDPSGGTAYVVVYDFTGGGNHVFKITNFGANSNDVTDISGNLPDTPVDSVAVSSDGKTVYVGTDVGVYSTNNGGTTWSPFGTGLPNAQVTDLEYVPSQNILAAGTYGRGAWEISTATAPVVTTNPSNQTVTAGQSATFTAAASGNPTPTVQWQYSSDGGTTWTNVGGASTSTTLNLSNVPTTWNGYEFEAVFTNGIGTATTAAATLTVQFAPTVTTNPANPTVTAGQAATFTAAAGGNPTPTVQWQVSSDGGNTFTNISGATSTTLTLSNVLFSLNGDEYRAVFTNSVGAATTSAALLTVQTVPVITSGNSAAFTVGQGGSFAVTATGSPTPTLTVAGVLPSGVTFTDNGNGTATLGGVPGAGTQGTYYFTIAAHNGAGSDAAQRFALTVNPAPLPPSPPPPPPPPTLNVPPLLAFLDGLLHGSETVNANGTETITDSLFGIPLLVSTFDQSGNLVSVTLFGFNVTFLFA